MYEVKRSKVKVIENENVKIVVVCSFALQYGHTSVSPMIK